ncbi:MAG: hypothetical protein IPJ09_13040 [Saprospiraceae bacterium]|nr:hypothetical protein [Saprospiraceae bacterium]
METFKLTLARGQKSITILEETDFDIFYAFKISNGLHPDRARYRGWNAQSKEYGYSPDGTVYNNANLLSGSVDATVDLTYNRTFYYPQLSLWDQAGAEQNTGRYWMVFNSHQTRSNLFGFYQGKPKLLIGARLSGPQLITRQQDDINKEPACADIGVTIPAAPEIICGFHTNATNGIYL